MANVSLLPASLESSSSDIGIESLEQSLAKILADEFRNEFRTIHLSGQLLKSIKVSKDDSDNYMVRIPPQIYDIAFYRRYKVVKNISTDSYAIDVNLSGGFSGLHKDYIQKCLSIAIQKWAMQNNIKYRIDAKVN